MKKTQKRKKHGMLRFSSLVKILLILLLVVCITLGTFLGAYVLSVLKQAPPIDPENFRNEINESSKVYDDQGKLIQNLVLNEFSEYVTLDMIPKDLQRAVIAVEDERFYDHNAVDFKRAIGALVHDLKTRSLEQGASTITMQLAKNLYTSQAKSLDRKLTDVFYAYELESTLTKDQILEAYLNSAGFSKGTVGVQAAAKTFFNKNVTDLNLAECALIAGITNRPEKYSPYTREPLTLKDNLETVQISLRPTGKDETNSKQTIEIGKKLLELGRIDDFEYKQILNNALVPTKAVFNPESKKRQELILGLMLKQGYITKDEYNEAMNTPIELNLGQRKEKGISSFYVDEVKKETVSILRKLGYSQEEAQNKLYTGGFLIHTSMDLDLQKKVEEIVSNPNIYPNNATNENGIPYLQIASVILDPKTGEVKSLIGGRDIAGSSNRNRATTPRQPGSSIKPISTYMTALEDGATAADVYYDQSLKNSNLPYKPSNDSNSYQGWTTIRNLLVRSSNVGSYLVARDIGSNRNSKSNTGSKYSRDVNEQKAVEKIVENLKKLGITTIVSPKDNPTTNDYNFSALALGGMTYGISPLQMAGAYTPLANEGIYEKPSFVQKITSSSGEVIYENKHEGKRVMSAQNAYILTDMLEDVVKKSTGRNANFARMHLAGKTGTTNSKKEAWFVGYSPYYVCSVFLGRDDHKPINLYGANAASIWRDIMQPIHEDLEDKDFPMPDGISKKYVKGTGRTELIVDGTEPHFTNKMYSYRPKPKKVYTDDDDDDKKDSDKKGRDRKDSDRDSDRDSYRSSGKKSKDRDSDKKPARVKSSSKKDSDYRGN